MGSDIMKALTIFPVLSVSLLLVTKAMSQEFSTQRLLCDDFTCPNSDIEGGLFTHNGPCSTEFCDCTGGRPYLYICPPGLYFHQDLQMCDWCYNMCDECSNDCQFCR